MLPIDIKRVLCSAKDEERRTILEVVSNEIKNNNYDEILKEVIDILCFVLLRDHAWTIRLATLRVLRDSVLKFFNGKQMSAKSLYALVMLVSKMALEEQQVILRRNALELCAKLASLPATKKGLHRITEGPLVGKEFTLSDVLYVTFGLAINDPYRAIRAVACEHLSLECCSSPTPSLQLLSKELLPTVEHAKWSSLPWSFCGSFIVALEDQFEDVRLAAVKTISKLAGRDRKFAEKAIDFLLDTSQDESEVVREECMVGVRSVLQFLNESISADRLELITAHLDDAEEGSRRAAYNCLAVCHIENEERLLSIFRRIPGVIEKFPSDTIHCYRSIFELGRLNAHLIGNSILRLLRVDKFFVPGIPKIEESSYTIRLAAIIAALHTQPKYDPAVPSFVYDHYKYLFCAYPSLIPDFKGHVLQERFSPGLKIFPVDDDTNFADVISSFNSSQDWDSFYHWIRNTPLLAVEGRRFMFSLAKALKEGHHLGTLVAKFVGLDPMLVEMFLTNTIPVQLSPASLSRIFSLQITIHEHKAIALECSSEVPLSIVIKGSINIQGREFNHCELYAEYCADCPKNSARTRLTTYQGHLFAGRLWIDASTLPLGVSGIKVNLLSKLSNAKFHHEATVKELRITVNRIK